MAQVYRFTDENGQVRLFAEIDPPPYTAPVTREIGTGTAVAIGDGASAPLEWAHQQVLPTGASALLNITAPTLPTIVADGTYAFALAVTVVGNMTALGYYTVALELDVQDEDATITVATPSANAVQTRPTAVLAVTYALEAGDEVTARVTNQDGASSQSFQLRSIIQRLA